ncbi:putative myocilin [Sesbania bispinosa]|nr:putative myocilin [Sesbania bispinosa]
MQRVLGQVKLLTKERDQLSTSVSDLTLQNKTLTEEKHKALDKAKAATDELELLRAEIEGLKKKDEESQKEIENLRRFGEESAGNGKWYRAQPDDNMECEPGDEEPASPVLEADAEEDGRGQRGGSG